MSVVVSNDHGWTLDHLTSTRLQTVAVEQPNPVMDTGAVTAGGGQEMEVYRMKSDLFKILTPFVMDSQMDKLMRKSTNHNDHTTKKKRKRKEPLNAGEQMALDYHEEVKPHIQLAYKTLMELARDRGVYLATGGEIDNNLAARKASQSCGPGDLVEESCMINFQSISSQIQECHVTDEKSMLQRGAVNTIWHHNGDSAMMVTLQSGRYILPQHSSFLMSDIEVLLSSYPALGKFNLIVLDPPWENKSVKRKKKYSSLSNERLLELPLGDLAAPGCLVVVWVTNRCRHIQFVTEELFPRHGITFMAKWFWLKVTCAGEMVCDFESAHKKPYETLIIGQCLEPDNLSSSCTRLPADEQTIISVPCSLHSKKPPLYEVLKSYLPCEPSCLELFARNLQSHWTSWGNEVLLHQHTDFYEKVT